MWEVISLISLLAPGEEISYHRLTSVTDFNKSGNQEVTVARVRRRRNYTPLKSHPSCLQQVLYEPIEIQDNKNRQIPSKVSDPLVSSRAYYSILHAARAVLLAEGVSVSSHRAVRGLFGHHLIKPGKLAVRLATILTEEQDDRVLADYDAWFHAERERAKKRVSEVAEFLAAINLFLKSHDEGQ